jgi:hypothetical protein
MVLPEGAEMALSMARDADFPTAGGGTEAFLQQVAKTTNVTVSMP